MRIQPAAGARERRLAALLAEAGRAAGDPKLGELVEDAQLLGSLELAGFRCSWQEVRSSRHSPVGPDEIRALRRAGGAVASGAPLTVRAIRAWHESLFGPVGFRRRERLREGAPSAPPDSIEGRLETLEEWLGSPGTTELKPEQTAALAYARIVEVLPFEDGNGRVGRLAASHVMVAAGAPPPILVGADAAYLLACLRAAFRLDTEPLVALLAEASSRALDVMIQALERGEG